MHMQLDLGFLITPDIVRHHGTGEMSKLDSQITSPNIRQCSITKAYYSHESGTWMAQRHITHSTLKMLSIMIFMGLCLVICIETKKWHRCNIGQPGSQD